MPTDFLDRYSKIIVVASFFALIFETIFSSYVLLDILHPKTPSLASYSKVDKKKVIVIYEQATKSATLAANVSQGEALGIAETPVNIDPQAGKFAFYLGFAVTPVTAANVHKLEETVGSKFNLLMSYVQWGNLANNKIDFSAFLQTGKTPIISWEPWDPDLGIVQPTYKLTNITAGNFDSYILQTALQMKKFGKPIFLRFAHEMNGNWYPWGGTVNGNSASDYISAWNHIYKIFKDNQVTNVTWIWSPDAKSYPEFKGNAISDFYPGDSSVDWVGLDGYNWGTTKTGKNWETFSQIFSGGYKQVLAYNKPIMAAETASTEIGGDKGTWIESAIAKEIPNSFSKIKALVWFDINKETNWQIDSSLNSISHTKSALKTSIIPLEVSVSAGKIVTPLSK